jgi:hypothetical protein
MPPPIQCAYCEATHSGKGQLPFLMCSACKKEAYCDKTCQAAHWDASHSTSCATLVDSSVFEDCAICLELLSTAPTAASCVTLPCSHTFHSACIGEMTKHGISKVIKNQELFFI